ncbi:ubiquitin-associated domain-containing protein 1-like isoform X2 [Watersipora subatra]|uniref:ubiquitin-associated domain-containing protein 1-like isoform X2 n=1 Tax=Watersipora subatra TaxID=2589382 RepID=UPI00355C0E23
MLVPHTINLTIITSQGKSCNLKVESTAGVHFIKRQAVESLYAAECAGQEPQAVKKALYFKLIHPATVSTLRDEATLFDEQVTKDCSLLLVKKRLDESRFSKYGAAAASRDKSSTSTPDAARIKEVTSKLEAKGTVQKQRDVVSAELFQRDLKRILVTLVESAQNILALNVEAAKIFKEAQEIMSQENTPELSNPMVPDESLSQLTDMGFSRERAIAALTRFRMSLQPAMDWLLLNPENTSNQNVDESTSVDVAEPISSTNQAGAASGSIQDHAESGRGVSDEANVSYSRRQSKAQTILESFRTYKRRKFKPNLMALSSLIDMGFDEADVLEALRVTDNNQESACEWLLGDRSHDGALDALEDGIDAASPLYQSIITNPVVQLGLSNPRCLLAFLHMLENGANTMDWLKDPDVGPILLQISRIYTAERSDCVFPGFGHD